MPFIGRYVSSHTRVNGYFSLQVKQLKFPAILGALDLRLLWGNMPQDTPS